MSSSFASGGYQTRGLPQSWFDAVQLGVSLLLSLAGILILIAWLLTHVHPWLTTPRSSFPSSTTWAAHSCNVFGTSANWCEVVTPHKGVVTSPWEVAGFEGEDAITMTVLV